jgi:hypothetical protein
MAQSIPEAAVVNGSMRKLSERYVPSGKRRRAAKFLLPPLVITDRHECSCDGKSITPQINRGGLLT